MKSKMTSQVEAIKAAMPEPDLELNEDILPDVKDWSVGKEYEITIKARLSSQREMGEYGMCCSEDNKMPKSATKKILARFKVVSAKVT